MQTKIEKQETNAHMQWGGVGTMGLRETLAQTKWERTKGMKDEWLKYIGVCCRWVDWKRGWSGRKGEPHTPFCHTHPMPTFSQKIKVVVCYALAFFWVFLKVTSFPSCLTIHPLAALNLSGPSNSTGGDLRLAQWLWTQLIFPLGKGSISVVAYLLWTQNISEALLIKRKDMWGVL